MAVSTEAEFDRLARRCFDAGADVDAANARLAEAIRRETALQRWQSSVEREAARVRAETRALASSVAAHGETKAADARTIEDARIAATNALRDATEMPLLLYDEPTAGLDPVACTRIEDLIVKTTTVAQGCSVVVSHVRSTIERSAERVVMLYGGRFRWMGSVDEFRSTENPYVVQFRTGSLRGPMQPAH